MRVGIGFDIREFDPTRVLVLGGQKVEGCWGLRGPSDGDVLVRALIDGCLGAAAMGGIDDHFPPGDEAFEGVPSAALLGETLTKLRVRGLAPIQVDATLVTDRDDLDAHRGPLRARIVELLGLAEDAVNLKRRPHQGLGGVGHADGVAVLAVVQLAASA